MMLIRSPQINLSSSFLFSSLQGPRRQLGSSRGRDDSRSTQGTPSPTPALVPSPEPGNRTGRQPDNRFETGNRTSAGTESVVTAAAPDLKPAAGQAVQVREASDWLVLASDWLVLVMGPKYWPLIG